MVNWGVVGIAVVGVMMGVVVSKVVVGCALLDAVVTCAAADEVVGIVVGMVGVADEVQGAEEGSVVCAVCRGTGTQPVSSTAANISAKIIFPTIITSCCCIS